MSKLKDITNQKFGRLLVLKQSENRINGRIAWDCQCDCGKKISVRGDSLRGGKTKSCGCLLKEKAKEMIAINGNNKIMQDLCGQTFGELTVLSLEKENNHSYWLCQCSCGNKYKALTYELTSGKRKSCGCLMSKDMIGKKFGRLTVIEQTAERGADRSIIWKCLCECGTTCNVNGSNLRSGHTTSCGCLNSKGEEKIKKILYENKITFSFEVTFSDCIFPDTGANARFDFLLYDKKTNLPYLIEYDGEQHFNMNSKWYSGERDKIKNNWCEKNKIPLIRIPYTHYDNLCLEDLLLETTNFRYI